MRKFFADKSHAAATAANQVESFLSNVEGASTEDFLRTFGVPTEDIEVPGVLGPIVALDEHALAINIGSYLTTIRNKRS